MTSLHWAAQNGHTDTVKILIDHKANVSTKDRYGKKDNTYIYIYLSTKHVYYICNYSISI